MIVVDASLATKWMLWERDTPFALRFLSRHRDALCGPDLLFVEVAHAIVRYTNMLRHAEDDTLEALRKWTIAWGQHAVRPYRTTQRRLYASARLAITLRHPLPDCIYLALAMEHSCKLATCDAKFHNKAIGVYPEVKLLGEFELTGDKR